MTKLLRITLTLTIEPDEFGLHALQPDARQFLTDLRANAIGHGFTVVTEPVEDAKGLHQTRKRTRGPGRKRAAPNGETNVTPILTLTNFPNSDP